MLRPMRLIRNFDTEKRMRGFFSENVPMQRFCSNLFDFLYKVLIKQMSGCFDSLNERSIISMFNQRPLNPVY